MLYLETNALIGIPPEMLPLINKEKILTSSFAIMEYIKKTTERNYYRRKELLKNLVSNIKYIDWDTPIEKISLMFDCLNIKKSKEYRKILKPLIDLYISSLKFSDFLCAINVENIVDIESVDNTYSYLQGLFLHLMNKDGFKEVLNTIIMCPQCFVANWIVQEMGDRKEEEKKALYELILSSYNNNGDSFFNACKIYIDSYLNQMPDRNDLIDLLHFLYLTKPVIKIVTNDKKMQRYAYWGSRRKYLTIDEFLEKTKIYT